MRGPRKTKFHVPGCAPSTTKLRDDCTMMPQPPVKPSTAFCRNRNPEIAGLPFGSLLNRPNQKRYPFRLGAVNQLVGCPEPKKQREVRNLGLPSRGCRFISPSKEPRKRRSKGPILTRTATRNLDSQDKVLSEADGSCIARLKRMVHLKARGPSSGEKRNNIRPCRFAKNSVLERGGTLGHRTAHSTCPKLRNSRWKLSARAGRQPEAEGSQSRVASNHSLELLWGSVW